MKAEYKRITWEDVQQLRSLLDQKKSYRAIAYIMGRSQCSVVSMAGRFRRCRTQGEFEIAHTQKKNKNVCGHADKISNGTIGRYIRSHGDETFEQMAKACQVGVSTIKFVYKAIYG